MTRILALALVLLAAPAAGADIETLAPEAVGKDARTRLGLYASVEAAHRALEADPSIVLIDVRDPHEVMFVGYPTAADANVPVALASHDYDAKKEGYAMKPNAGFVAEVDAVMAREGKGRGDVVLVMCRSGGRSAMAANRLAEAGYTAVHNVVGGFEGDKGPAGARTVNGWRNAGLPWTYAIDPETAWTPKAAGGSD